MSNSKNGFELVIPDDVAELLSRKAENSATCELCFVTDEVFAFVSNNRFVNFLFCRLMRKKYRK
jgi:hypothetical protein